MNFSLKAKLLTIKQKGVRNTGFFIFTFIIAFSFAISSKAQVENPVSGPGAPLPSMLDSLGHPADSLSIKNDTLTTNGEEKKTPSDSTQAIKKGDIETTIYYSARDSINSNLQSKIIKLYGKARIKYGLIELEADEIVIDYESSTISANGKLDSLGTRSGYPIFKNGAEVYETKSMVYNFKNKKAKISEVVTQQGDGYMHGGVVYKNEQNELFTINNAYTTCNLPEPHFQIISKRAKAIPGDKIVTGPFYMEFNGVPTPFGFAFGLFPSPKKSASGILVPSYGEEGRRGFFLKKGGYYFDINDYVKLSLTADIFSKGASALYLNTIYRKRYHYSGNFNFTFTNNRLSDKIEDPQKIKDFRIVWSHSPQTKGTGRFSASLNAATSSYSNNNFLGLNANPTATSLDNTSRKLSSNISYSKSFAGTPFSMGVNLRHNQDLKTKQVDLPLPDLSFNINNIYPFKNSSNLDILENLSVRYTATGTNKITNNLGRIGKNPAVDSIAPLTFSNLGQFMKNARRGARHNIPLSTSVRVLRFFAISPSFNYDEIWYFDKLNWQLDPKGKTAVVKDTIKGFNRISNYSFSVGMTTRLYGMYLFKNPNSKIKAIRHVINPSIGFSYQPNFGDPKYDYYQRFTTTDNRVLNVSRYQGYVYGGSSLGESRSMSFGVNNNLEMKVQSPDDSVARKVSLLNTLSFSSGYNFAADSFKLAPFSLAANTNVLNNKLNVNLTANLDPYEYRIDSIVSTEKKTTIYETKINRYAWQDGFRLGQITNTTFAISTNLSPKGKKSDAESRDKISKSNLSESDKQFLLNNPDAYVDFEIPWNLRVSYNVNYSKAGHQKSTVTQTLRFNGDISLSAKWKATFNSGYDFKKKAFTQTLISIRRDLHCWQMSLGWTPFGRYQSYNFSIGVKSGMLQDLKLDRTRSFFDSF